MRNLYQLCSNWIRQSRAIASIILKNILFSNLVDRQRLDRASRPCLVLSLPRHLWALFCLSRHAMAGCAAFDRPSTSRYHQLRRGAVLRPCLCCQSALASIPPPHKDIGIVRLPGGPKLSSDTPFVLPLASLPPQSHHTLCHDCILRQLLAALCFMASRASVQQRLLTKHLPWRAT